MHFMCLEAVDKVLKDPVLLRLFRIPSDLWPGMRKSWGLTPKVSDIHEYERRGSLRAHTDFLGRFDWSWDGEGLPKLLEYNADTPSMILESGAVQQQWFADKFEDLASDSSEIVWQSNGFDELMAEAAERIVRRCRSDFRVPFGYGSAAARQVGLMTVDYDDESAAQMLEIMRYF